MSAADNKGASSEQENKALMEKLASGDSNALDKLYLRLRETVEAFVRKKIDGAASAIEVSDLVQDVFRRVQQKASLYKPTGRVSSWICKIAENVVKNATRGQQRRLLRDTQYAYLRPPQGGELPVPEYWEHGADPVEGEGDFYIVPRLDGGSNLVWVRTFPMRRVKWVRVDKLRKWSAGYGRDDVPSMFKSIGLVREKE